MCYNRRIYSRKICQVHQERRKSVRNFTPKWMSWQSWCFRSLYLRKVAKKSSCTFRGSLAVSVIQKLRQKRIKLTLRNTTFVLVIFRKEQFWISQKDMYATGFVEHYVFNHQTLNSALFTKGMFRLKSDVLKHLTFSDLSKAYFPLMSS